MDSLFSSVDDAKEKTELCIKLSYFEIYNEKLQDLLKPENDNLPVHEKKGSPYVKVRFNFFWFFLHLSSGVRMIESQ